LVNFTKNFSWWLILVKTLSWLLVIMQEKIFSLTFYVLYLTAVINSLRQKWSVLSLVEPNCLLSNRILP